MDIEDDGEVEFDAVEEQVREMKKAKGRMVQQEEERITWHVFSLPHSD